MSAPKPAYAFEGARWTLRQTITWSLPAPAAGNPFTDPLGAAAIATIQAAFAHWHAVSRLTFIQTTDTAAHPADIRLGYVALDSGNEIGLTLWHAAHGIFQPGTLIELQDPKADPLASRNGTLTYAGTATTLAQVVLHEIGHALGLAHATDPNAIMYPTLSLANRTTDATDSTAIHLLYSTGATTSPAAGSLAADAALLVRDTFR